MKFTAKEQAIIDILRKHGPVSTRAVAEKLYGSAPPLNARTIVMGRLRGIARKAEAMGEDWRLHSTARKGPHPINFWIVSA